jgi:uncharacterized protein
MTTGSFPHITAATAIVLAVLQMLLMLPITVGRRKYRVGLGDGGNSVMVRRIRMHGNLAENAPLFLILLALTEATGQWGTLVPIIAAAFVVFRLLHAVGLWLSAGPTPFRFVGVLGSFCAIVGLAVMLSMTLARDTSWIPHF